MTDTSGTTQCGCCGQDHPEADLVRLAHRSDVAICHGCAAGLALRRGGLVRAVPVLRTPDLRGSIRFWSTAGFSVNQYGGDFASAHRDLVELHLVETSGRDRGEAYLHARGVDELYDAWTAAALPASEPRDEPWEMREFNLVDPGGNRLRIGQNL